MAGIEEKEKKRAAAGSNKKCEIAPRGPAVGLRVDDEQLIREKKKEQRVSLSYIISITAIFSAGLAAIRERQKRLCV